MVNGSTSYVTEPEHVTCFEFEIATGDEFLVQYHEWKKIFPKHWCDKRIISSCIFQQTLQLCKEKTGKKVKLFLPTCITCDSSAELFQFWSEEIIPCEYNNMRGRTLLTYKNQMSSDKKMIYMSQDYFYATEESNSYIRIDWPLRFRVSKIETEEAFIIFLKQSSNNEGVADILHIRKNPFKWEEKIVPMERDLLVHYYKNVKWYSSLHKNVTDSTPYNRLPNKRKGSGYCDAYWWINPLIANTDDFREALSQANARCSGYYNIEESINLLSSYHIEIKNDDSIGLYISRYGGNIQDYKLKRNWSFYSFHEPYELPEMHSSNLNYWLEEPIKID